MIFRYYTTSIHEGEITRTNNYLFFLLPLKLSKSFTECIDCILKTEVTLPPDIALRVRTASLVNIYGCEGKNKAANMHQKRCEPTERLDKMFKGKQD